MKTTGDGMDIVYMLGLFVAAIFAAYLIIKMQDENLFGNKSKIFEKIRQLEATQKAQDALLNSNILTTGKTNQALTELRKDLACADTKIDRMDLEVDHLQEHCAKLRESLLDIKEMVSSKRPIVRIPPIQVTLPAGVFNVETVKKVKGQLKGLQQ